MSLLGLTNTYFFIIMCDTWHFTLVAQAILCKVGRVNCQVAIVCSSELILIS